MLRIDQVKNVNNTLKQPNFKAGVQWGKPSVQKENIVENGLFTVFTSTIKDIFSNPQTKSRAKSIEAGLENKTFDAIA